MTTTRIEHVEEVQSELASVDVLMSTPGGSTSTSGTDSEEPEPKSHDSETGFLIQTVVQDLFELLEEFEPIGCFKCNRLKCCCASNASTFRTVTISLTNGPPATPKRDRSMDVFYNVAPPPQLLPTPKWPENKPNDRRRQENPTPKPISPTERWVKASTPCISEAFPVPTKILQEVNYSWPPFPRSIWSKEMLKKTLEKEDSFGSRTEESGNGSVEAFFRYFGRDRPVPKPAFAC